MFSTTDPLNREVHLKRETWEHKILNMYGTNDNNQHGNSHPEMENLLPEVKKTIENPNFIIHDTYTTEDEEGHRIISVSDDREEYIRIFNDKKAEKLKALKVVVEFSEEIGDIVTSHTSNSLKSFKTSGGIVYDSSKK